MSGVAVEGAVTGSYDNESATDVGAGGFAGLVAAARIATSWYSGCVDSRGGYVGAFVGKASIGLVTNSYYDTSANYDMKAVGKNSGGSADYVGITPIGPAEKYNAASYPSFDFTNTWSIAEGVDEPQLVPLTSFTLFLDDCNLPLGTNPDADVNGISVGARYVFGIYPALGPADLAEPLIDIKFDTNGKPYVKLPALANTEGATVTVLATEDLSDWTHVAEYPVDSTTGICLPDLDPVPDHMFFKYKILLEGG